MSHVGQAGNCSEPSRGAAQRHREPDTHLRRESDGKAAKGGRREEEGREGKLEGVG